MELLAPLIEAIGLVTLVIAFATKAVDTHFALLFFLVAYGSGLAISILALLLEELTYHRYSSPGDRLMLLLWATAENLGYRQLTVIWRLRGLWRWLRKRSDWGTMQRQGFAQQDAKPVERSANRPQ